MSLTENMLYTSNDFEGFPDGLGVVSRDTPIVLLSDTHWYWWYVRIVNTGYEQFVPADIVEFPEERLARKNMTANEIISYVPTEHTTSKTHKRKNVRFSTELYYEGDSNVPELTSDSDSDVSLPSSPIVEEQYSEITPAVRKSTGQHLRIIDVSTSLESLLH